MRFWLLIVTLLLPLNVYAQDDELNPLKCLSMGPTLGEVENRNCRDKSIYSLVEPMTEAVLCLKKNGTENSLVNTKITDPEAFIRKGIVDFCNSSRTGHSWNMSLNLFKCLLKKLVWENI